MKKTPGQAGYNSKFSISIGIVKNNSDLAQQGRLQVFLPSVDSGNNIANLPWAIYVSPFGGTTANLKVGRSKSPISGATTYGFWAIPKVGAQVLCGFLEGDPSVRYWLGSVFLPEMNRTLPQSIEGGLTEIDDSGTYAQSSIAFQQANLVKAGLQPGTIHYKSRGGYERSVSYPKNKSRDKPTTNGYGSKPLQGENSDSQTICLTSPGRHYFVMSDVDEYCRIRLKTTEGSQIIFDDTNERIYISTARGKNWVELDEGNGKIYLYSDSKISIRAKNDINLYSDENINIVANKRVNIKSQTRSVNLEANHDIRLLSNQGDLMLTASRDIQLKTTNGPIAVAIAEKSYCSSGTLGWVHEWAEKGGSSTSSIRLDASTNIEGSSMQNINLTSKTGFNARSMTADLTIQAGANVNLNATDMVNVAGASINLPGPAIPADSAASASAVSSTVVTDQMIVPDHEPWVRDADESKCKTVRNVSYQG
jgi:hypothetical protein